MVWFFTRIQHSITKNQIISIPSGRFDVILAQFTTKNFTTKNTYFMNCSQRQVFNRTLGVFRKSYQESFKIKDVSLVSAVSNNI
jgi:hypothetical protein